MKKIYVLIAVFIIVTTITTRFVGLDKSPPHLSNDEISIAYDAYSVSRTLRDEHNQFLPISFQSHGTHKAPLTAYLTSFSVLFLGNNEYSARLPSAVLGSLTVLILGILVYELTKNINLSLLTSVVLAITPWHIYTSRMILESNIALFFFVGGLFFFFYSISRNKNITFILSFIFFALSMYAYHTEWGLTPIIVGMLFMLYKKRLLNKKICFVGLLLFSLLVIPLFLDYTHNLETNARANTEILFTQESLKKQFEVYPNNVFRKGQILFSRVIGTYSSYVKPDYLFFNSPNLLPKTDPFQAGFILAPLLPMFIFGLFRVKKYFGDYGEFIYLWLISSPFVPALTVGEAHVVRNLPFVAPCVIIIAIGCCELIIKFQKKKIILSLYTVLILLSFFYFSAIYYYYFPKESGENFQYGYKQIALFIKPRYEDYIRIIIDPKFGEGYVFDGVPHLYIPYFTLLDPKFLQERINNNPCGNCFAKYEIRGIDWTEEVLQRQIMYIVPSSNRPPIELEKQMIMLTEVKLPNQRSAFIIYEKG